MTHSSKLLQSIKSLPVTGRSGLELPTLNLYEEEDGMSILLDEYGDIVDSDEDPVVRVIGYGMYCRPLSEAHDDMRREALGILA